MNDSHGHHIGDKVLIAVARLLQAHTRETDVIGRWRDEEFIVICTQTDQAGAVKLAENLRQTLQQEELLVVHQKTASFGVATYHLNDQPKDIVARADAALYEAKRNGRNRVEAR